MMDLIKVFEMFQDGIPDYIISLDMSGIEVAYENPNGESGQYRYVYQDVVKYFEDYTGDMVNSMRTFGPMIGDHRMMDTFVNEIHALFIHLDPEGYRDAYKNSYLKPNW